MAIEDAYFEKYSQQESKQAAGILSLWQRCIYFQ